MLRLSLFLSLITSLAAGAAVPDWKKDIGETVQNVQFLANDKYMFVTSGEYAWLFDANTGAEVYALEVPDYEPKGVHYLADDIYIVSSEDKLMGYNALTGKLLWEQEYDIDQATYTSMDFISNVTLIRYGALHLAIDIKTGKMLWSEDMEYNAAVKQKGGWNYDDLSTHGKYLSLLDGDRISIKDIRSGRDLVFMGDFEIETDLPAKGLPFSFTTPSESYGIFILDDALSIIDYKNNKESHRMAFESTDDYAPFVEIKDGVLIFGEKQIVLFNYAKNSIVSVDAEIDDFRTYKVMEHAGVNYLFGSMDERMFAMDLTNGKKLWETKEDDKDFEGYAHKYIGIVNNTLILSYADGQTTGSDAGTWCRIFGLDMKTGALKFRSENVLRSKVYINGFSRAVGGWAAKSNPNNPYSWNNLGFDYETRINGDKLIIAACSKSDMRHPATNEDGGDGIAVVDLNNGKVLFSSYSELNDYSWNMMQQNMVTPLFEGDMVYLIGDRRAAAYDTKSLKKLWETDEIITSFPTEAAIRDEVLYIKTGGIKFDVHLSPPGLLGLGGVTIKVNEKWEEDPYGFTAIDITSGQKLWTVETETDPAFNTPNFSFANNYDEKRKNIYFSDEKNLYALKTGKDGGKYNYTISLPDAGIGSIALKKSYAIQEFPLAHESKERRSYDMGNYTMVTTKTSNNINKEELGKFTQALAGADAYITYKLFNNTWGAVGKKALVTVYGQDRIFIIGSSGIGLFEAADGKPVWISKWNYDQDNVEFMPTFVKDKLLYCADEKFTLVDMKDGSIVWQGEETADSRFVVAPNGNFVLTIDDEDVAGYKIP